MDLLIVRHAIAFERDRHRWRIAVRVMRFMEMHCYATLATSNWRACNQSACQRSKSAIAIGRQNKKP